MTFESRSLAFFYFVSRNSFRKFGPFAPVAHGILGRKKNGIEKGPARTSRKGIQ
jgi:hypothetical protein